MELRCNYIQELCGTRVTFEGKEMRKKGSLSRGDSAGAMMRMLSRDEHANMRPCACKGSHHCILRS